ncbi:S41 family peptidase [Muricomes intestini]|jgi:carboxyl-terminal processing protease|uniref:Carboxyl-terminal processing protease n=1 Tax=Muricomes intestini TaxID=1796634 RepID=A0A4R3K3C6_9FIRM|nr:S41 family peptidase [Muricomes intestini]TCS77204.1 carboxyl-terminal processing protease [Muricomes intestini]HAX53707.1 S41 family peptidase [Lachnospiraceae bacterium]HCR82295.1 S41 family peptidase [Lachnospiraceae bacterium]
MNDKKSFRKGALCGALVMLLIAAAGLGIRKTGERYILGDGAAAAQVSSQTQTERKLTNLGRLIDHYYLYTDKLNNKALQDGIYTGYVSGLGDPYTVYYDKEQTKELLETTSGEYSGIGAGLVTDIETKAVTIANIYKDSPAEEAGLKEGDILYQVDDHVVGDEDLTEIVSWIKGKEGTDVTLHVYRGSAMEQVTCTATRRSLKVQTVDYEMKENQVGYIHITEFDQVTYDQFKDALADLENQGMKGLVIDLRSNPGGDLDTVVDMLKLLLPKGMVVYTEDKNGNRTEYKNEKDHEFTKPLTVLVNQYSASAAEIFSGAIQDYKVGSIVGTTTYGKGIVQQLMDLGDGTCLKVTIAEYFLPSGRSIHKKGIKPDVEVEYKADPGNAAADNQLDEALEVLQGKM